MATSTVQPTGAVSSTYPAGTTNHFTDVGGTGAANLTTRADGNYRSAASDLNRGDYWSCGTAVPAGATSITAVITVSAWRGASGTHYGHICWKLAGTEYTSLLTLNSGTETDFSTSSIPISSIDDANGMLVGYDNIDSGISYLVRIGYVDITFTYTPGATETFSPTDFFLMD